MTTWKILAGCAIGALVATIGLEHIYRERPLGDALWDGIWFFVFFSAGSLFFEGVSRYSKRRKAFAQREGEARSGLDPETAIQAAALVALAIMMALYAEDKLVAFALLGLLSVPVVWNWMK